MDVTSAYIRFIGTAATQPYRARNASAILLKFKQLRILLDCGENTTRKLLSLQQSLAVDVILISHLHGDHFYGLFGLLDTLNKNLRSLPLFIYGPPGIYKIKEIHAILHKKFGFEIFIQIFPLEHAISIGEIDISAYKMVHGTINYGYCLQYKKPVKLDIAKIKSAGLETGPWCKAALVQQTVKVNDIEYNCAQFYKEQAKTIRIFYSGDTVPINLNLKVDYLIHECTYYNELDLAKLNKHTAYTQRHLLIKYYDPAHIYFTHISEKFHALIPKLKPATNTTFVRDGYIVPLVI